jgi:hypothetical protein
MATVERVRKTSHHPVDTFTDDAGLGRYETGEPGPQRRFAANSGMVLL